MDLKNGISAARCKKSVEDARQSKAVIWKHERACPPNTGLRPMDEKKSQLLPLDRRKQGKITRGVLLIAKDKTLHSVFYILAKKYITTKTNYTL